ncbi:DUF3152 domain-containing protein [Longispora urticae]
MAPSYRRSPRRARLIALAVVLAVMGLAVASQALPPTGSRQPTAVARPGAEAGPPGTETGAKGGTGAKDGAGTETGATSGGGSDSAPPVTYPPRGAGTFAVAQGDGPPLGHAGTLLRFQVVVENGIGNLDPATAAVTVEATLGDRRGWTADGRWTFQRVGPNQTPDFIVYVATPETRDDLCGMGPDGYTSCRNGDRVVLNVARWAEGVPGYGAPVWQYREYMVNHEVGHRLGFDHELCPGAGKLAPVMQQQTLGLQGCLPNSWPHQPAG